jgi:site-specific DNA-methyltransferase (adenine-specific)
MIQIINGDARRLPVKDESIHCCITSPPYNGGISYHKHNDSMDADEYLEMLSDVWDECKRVLVPGGRIAVNVPFQMFTKPAYPLSAQVTLQLAGKFELLNTIVWEKPGSSDRTSWGSWRSCVSPAIRDSTESIIIARKPGKFEIPDGVLVQDNEKGGKYSPWLDAKTFLALTKDVWVIPPVCSTAVKNNHPAPYPVSLPDRLIRLYGFPGCNVLDPFAGSGTTGQAAKNLGANAILVDIDMAYCELMADRLLKQQDLFEEETA